MKPAYRYETSDGEQIARHDWDTHHIFARSTMRGRNEKDWADLFTVPMVKTYHNMGKAALHTNVELPPRPDKELMHRIRVNRYENATANPYDRFIQMSEFVHEVAETSPHEHTAWLAGRIADNLERQAPFILLGMVTIQELD